MDEKFPNAQMYYVEHTEGNEIFLRNPENLIVKASWMYLQLLQWEVEWFFLIISNLRMIGLGKDEISSPGVRKIYTVPRDQNWLISISNSNGGLSTKLQKYLIYGVIIIKKVKMPTEDFTSNQFPWCGAGRIIHVRWDRERVGAFKS